MHTTKNQPDRMIPCQKHFQTEKDHPNKQIFPTGIEIIIGHPTSKCPLQESELI